MKAKWRKTYNDSIQATKSAEALELKTLKQKDAHSALRQKETDELKKKVCWVSCSSCCTILIGLLAFMVAGDVKEVLRLREWPWQANVCTLSNATGYDIGSCDAVSTAKTIAQCSLTCAPGYTASGPTTVNCLSDHGQFNITNPCEAALQSDFDNIQQTFAKAQADPLTAERLAQSSKDTWGRNTPEPGKQKGGEGVKGKRCWRGIDIDTNLPSEPCGHAQQEEPDFSDFYGQ
jgi:hypothetical protein